MKSSLAIIVVTATLLGVVDASADEWASRSFSGAKIRFQGVSPEQDWFYIEQTGPAEGLMIGWPGDLYQNWQQMPGASVLTMIDAYYLSDVTVSRSQSWKLGTIYYANGLHPGEAQRTHLEAAMTIEISGVESPSGYFDIDGVWHDLAVGEFWENDVWRLGILQNPAGDDAVYLLDHPELGYFYVPEGQSGYLDVYAKFGSIDPVLLQVNGGVGTLGGGASMVPEGGSIASLLALVSAGLLAVGRRYDRR